MGVGAFGFFLIGVSGAIMAEISRVYYFFKLGSEVLGSGGSGHVSLIYSAAWNFAAAFGAVATVIAFVSCPLFMVQVAQRH